MSFKFDYGFYANTSTNLVLQFYRRMGHQLLTQNGNAAPAPQLADTMRS